MKTKRKRKPIRDMEKSFRNRRGKYIYQTKTRIEYMRSTWETAYAMWLDSQNLTWYYEPYCIRLPIGDYFPDFYVLDNPPYWVEIKGRMTRRAAQKIKEFKQLYSEDKLILLQKRDLEKLGVLPIIQKTNA